MKALVLAAGYATRLYPLTLDRPKALLEVAGRPMLDHVVERLLPMGIDGTIVVTNAKFAPHFEEWAAGREDVTVVDDGTTSNDDRLGAIGDIGFVLDRLGIDEELVVVAGDNLFGEDVSGLVVRGREVDAPVIAVHDVGDLSRMGEYNQIDVDADGRIVFFEEKPADARTTLAGVALYYYPRQTLPLVRQYLDEGQNPDQPGRLVEWLYPRTPFYTWLLPGSGTTSARRRPSRKPTASFRRAVTPSCRQWRHARRARAAASPALRRLRRPWGRALRSLPRGVRPPPPSRVRAVRLAGPVAGSAVRRVLRP